MGGGGRGGVGWRLIEIFSLESKVRDSLFLLRVGKKLKKICRKMRVRQHCLPVKQTQLKFKLCLPPPISIPPRSLCLCLRLSLFLSLKRLPACCSKQSALPREGVASTEIERFFFLNSPPSSPSLTSLCVCVCGVGGQWRRRRGGGAGG